MRLLVDDYAHHPTEICSTLQGARLSFPNRRIRAIFQPHTFSHTEKLLQDFSRAFQSGIYSTILNAQQRQCQIHQKLTLIISI